MNALCRDALIEKIENVLETMCFVMADPTEANGDDELPSLRAWIRFHNEDESSCLQLAATRGFVKEATMGLLGVDVEDSQSGVDALEMLLELANVVGGEVVSLLGSEGVYFEMGIPSREEQQLPTAQERTSIAFDSMGEVLRVDLARGPKTA